MTHHLQTDPSIWLWALLAFLVAGSGAWLALGWGWLIASGTRWTQPARLLAAGASLGTAVWSSHGLVLFSQPQGFAIGHRVDGESAVWLLSVAAATAIVGWWQSWEAPPPGRSKSRKKRKPDRLWLHVSVALGSVIVALQMGCVLTSGWQPGVRWQPVPLLIGWLASVIACVAGFGVLHSGRRRGDRAVWRRPVAAVWLGVACIGGQVLVSMAAGLHMQVSSAHVAELSSLGLHELASLGSLLVLAVSLAFLRRAPQPAPSAMLSFREQSAHPEIDAITGLPNEAMFEGTLAQAVKKADASERRLALLLVNLDGFKNINQRYGFRDGDRLLREIGARLRVLCDPHMAARLPNDEFLVLLNTTPRIDDPSTVAHALLDAIAEPFAALCKEPIVSASIGVVLYPQHGALSTMVTHARAAMRAAKTAGGASHCYFDPAMLNGSRESTQLLRDLRAALGREGIDRRQLELYFQPKIHAASGEVTGAEALLRWQHPHKGMISPETFIPLAERHGLINSLGRWVIDEACRQARVWRDEGLRMRVAVNLSVHQLRQPDLSEQIAAALAKHQINPDLITCEITESSAMQEMEVTMRVLGQLDALGVHISIDDFGTGHSSLAYLRKLPADELKIDRSFVLDLETSEDARKVASAVINLAQSLNLKVVAEGVETEEQNRILREFGCDQLQGYLFAKPMSAKALGLWAMEDVGPRTLNFRASLFKETAPAAIAA